MMRRDWTKAELDRMAGAYYAGLHDGDCSTPWEAQPDWRRHKHRRGVWELTRELAEIEAERRAAFRASHRRTVRVERVG